MVLLMQGMSLFAQKEANIWYFGREGTGLNFNTNPPSVLTNSALSESGGSSSMADVNGNLLFYSDGMIVWNKNHQIMTNGLGLKGWRGGADNSLIIKYPEKADMFIIFTLGQIGANSEVCYSIIDMKLSAGLGAVTSKNIQLLKQSSQKIAAINHANKRDIWVSIASLLNDTIYSFLVTPLGVDLNVVINTTGIPTLFFTSSAGGEQMKFSSDASKLAITDHYNGTVIISEFNNSTGIISNRRIVSDFKSPNGIEFSPNSQFFYLSDYNDSCLFQCLIPNTNTGKACICKTIDIKPYKRGRRLQLGPDHKIYVIKDTHLYGAYLDVIEEPNNYYPNCGYMRNVIYFKDKFNYSAFPTFYQTFFSPIGLITASSVYLSDSTNISINIDNTSIDSINWYIGDTLTPIVQGSKIKQFKYLSLDTLPQIILAKVYSNSSVQNYYGSLITITYPSLNLITDNFICIGESITLKKTYPGAKYLWQDGTTDSFYIVKKSGLHSVTITLNGCTVKDSIQIKDNFYPKVNLPNDTIICEGVPFYLKATNPQTNYLWSNFSTDSIIKITQSGTYWVKAYNVCGTSFDTTEIKIEACNCYIYVPNAFTPNGNGLNEVFLPVSNCKITNYQLIILNRWGVKIFESNNPNIGWNGKLNDILQSNDVYVYQIQADLIDNIIGTNKKQVSLKGNVTLLN